MLLRDKRFVMVASAAVLGALVASPAALASGGSASAASSGASHEAARSVTLVTGDRVQVSTSTEGRQTAAVVSAHRSGAAGVFQTFTRGGDLYVVPESAVPYLSTTLDVGLFDVTRLAAHPRSDLPVTVQLTSGGAKASIAGLTLQSRSGSSVHGSFSSAGARAFGTALARQARRDHASPTHTTGLFRGVARITAGSAAPAASAVRPGAKLHTLTVDGTNWAGDPDNGDSMTIYNVDDLNTYNNFVSFSNGTAQLNDVPNGHYAGVAFFYDFNTGTIYQVTLAQFTVKGDTTVSVDARDATSKVSITTPKPATPMSTAVEVARADTNGLIGSYSFLAGDQTFYVKPITKAPSVGKLYYFVYTREYSAAGAKQNYTYDLKFPSNGTIAKNQHYAPAARSLAAIKSGYAAAHAGQNSLDARFGALPWESFLIASDVPFTSPTQRTEYYSARKNLAWSGVDYQVYVSDPFTLQGEIDSSWRTYKPGYSASLVWGGQPNHPRLLQHDIFLNQTVCPACLEGSTLDALAFPYADNSDEHRSYQDGAAAGLQESQAWAVKADGTVVQQGSGVLQASATVPNGAKDYEISYNTTRSSSDFTLSTSTKTTWTVPTDAPQPALPKGWTCTLSGGTDCSVLPLMSVDYALPVNLLGEIPAGSAKGSVSITHLAHAKVSVSTLKARVSYDGGKTYKAVKVSGGSGGTFTLTFTVPKPGQTDGFGSLSISAKDANGATLREKIVHAFAVTAS